MISFQMTVSHQPDTVILHRLHGCSVIRGESHEAVLSDAMVRRQRAKSLKFRGCEQGVALLLQRPFSSAVNAHYSQLLIITCQAGGSSRICDNTT